MQEESINSLYEVIVKNSWTDDVDDYLKFLFENAIKYETKEIPADKLVDVVLKKILSNLQENVNINVYDSFILNMGKYINQDGFDFAIGLIKSFYRDNFKFNGEEYSTMEIMYNIVEQYKTKDTLPIPEIFHYILASLFRTHYALYVKEHE